MSNMFLVIYLALCSGMTGALLALSLVAKNVEVFYYAMAGILVICMLWASAKIMQRMEET